MRTSTGPRLAAVALMALACRALAHDYWLMPETFTPTAGSVLKAHFSDGHHYFANEELPDITKFRAFVVLPDGRELGLPFDRIESTQAAVRVPLVGSGTYILGAVSTQPELWSTTEKGHRAGGRAEVPDALSTSKYVKSVKTFLTLGQPSDHWGAVLGHETELVPQTNPTLLKAGDNLALKVWLQGRPAAGAEVFGVYDGFDGGDKHEAAINAHADAQGLAQVTPDRAGVWLFYSRVERDAAPETGLKKENFRAYLLVQVAAAIEGARP